MERIVFLCGVFSLPFLCWTSADRSDSVSLYGGSSVGPCSAAGVRDNLTFIANYTDLPDALEELERNATTEFSHFTVCLRGDGAFTLSPVNLTVSVGIQSAAGPTTTERSRIYCNAVPSKNYSAFFRGSQDVRLENLRFEGCTSPIGLELVETVVIVNCSFRYFTEAVFDIFNCQDTNIVDSVFEHNSGHGLSGVTSRGNTGGVAIGFRNAPPSMREVSVIISNTTFLNNTAFSTSFLLALDRLVYPGRGGALGMFMSHAFDNVTVVISHCSFVENTAALFGGGIFYLVTHESYRHKLLIDNTTFDSNSGLFGASGVMLANPLSLEELPGEREPVLFKIRGCRFVNHTANSGGSISLFPSYLTGRGSQMILSDSVFVNNRENESDPFAHGSAIAISEINIFSDRSSIPVHQITNCTFVNNSGQNGIVNDGYAPILFSGANRFLGNKGTPLKLVGSLVELTGQMDFINNTVSNGAALFFTSFAQARLHRGLRILFQGNIGRLGASIFVDNPTFSLSSIYNPLCFFLYEDSTSSPTQWDDINITSTRNSALEGSTLYIRRLEHCNWVSLSPPFNNNTAIRDWIIWDIRNNSNTGFEGDIKTDASEMSVTTREVSPWPGQNFPVSLTVRDQFDLPTSVTAQFLFNANEGGGGERVVLQPELTAITSRAEFTQNFSSVTSSRDASGTVLISNGLQSKAFQTQLLVLNSFSLDLVPCPGGYTPMSIETREGLWGCVCDTGLENLVLCSSDQDTIFITSGMWATYVPPAVDGSHNIEFYPCPPDYCSCVNDVITDVSGTVCMYAYTNSNPDLQCSCNRRGVLCGECANSSSVTALFNRCSDCSNHSFLLIPALIIVDVVVSVFIAVLNAPLPEWTYPFLFYIQMAPYAVQYFPLSFSTVGKYLYFVGSASSFYFVYDFCLYNGMTSLGGSALRYLPLLTGAATLLPLLGLKLCMSKRRSTIKYHGLWMIVLLSFSHVVYTSMSLLNCPSITDSNGHTSPRWFVNGEVECFSGSHLYLGVAAGIILLLAFLLTVTTTVLPLTQARHKRQWVTKLSSTLSFSYRDKCEWWASVELSRRIFLIFVLLTFPRNTTLVILVLAGILALFGHAHPYKHRLTNISEVAVLTNFIILLALRQTPYVIDEYFQFPSEEGEGGCGDNVPRGVATISWILLPLYYLPVLVFAVLIIARIVLYGAPPLWARVKKIKIRRREEGGFHDNSLSMSHRRPASSMPTTHTSLRIARGVTHGIASVIRSNKKKKSWRNNGLELRATTADDHEDLIDPFL